VKEQAVETLVRPYALARDEGEALSFLGIPTWVKATGEQTGGGLGLVEQLIPAGFASPWHVHHAEDEAFYVATGELTFICGDERIVAGAGAWVWAPKDVPHGFRVEGEMPARLLLFSIPSGFEQFVIAASARLASPPDMAHLLHVAAEFQIDILGPLPV
jgi:quercetin dioxygenase-like cupin family protein